MWYGQWLDAPFGASPPFLVHDLVMRAEGETSDAGSEPGFGMAWYS
jgi:hypothetical protein